MVINDTRICLGYKQVEVARAIGTTDDNNIVAGLLFRNLQDERTTIEFIFKDIKSINSHIKKLEKLKKFFQKNLDKKAKQKLKDKK